MANRSVLDEAIKAQRKRRDDEAKRQANERALESRRTTAPPAAKRTERVKDDDVRKQPAPKPQNKVFIPGAPAPQENKVFIPTWRSDKAPTVDSSQNKQRYDPLSSGNTGRQWRPPSSPMGDRESLDVAPPGLPTGLQVGLSTPRPNTGPVGISSSQQQAPTLTTPSVQPWRPPQWNMEEERDNKLGAPTPTLVNRPQYNPLPTGSSRTPTAVISAMPAIDAVTSPGLWDVAKLGAQGVGQWASDLWGDATEKASEPESWGGADLTALQPPERTAYDRVKDDFTNSGAYEDMQYNMAESRKPSEGLVQETKDWASATGEHAADTRGKLGQEIGDWWAGKQGLWDTVKGVTQTAWEAEQSAPAAPNVTKPLLPVTNQLATDAMTVLNASQQYYLGKKTEDILGEDVAKSLGVEGVTVGAAAMNLPLTATPAMYDAIWNGHFDPRDIAAEAGKAYFNEMDAYRKAVQPSLQDLQNMTGEEIARNQKAAMLNYNSPQQVAETYRKLTDQQGTAAGMLQTAQQIQQLAEQQTDPKKRTEMLALAADYGHAGQELKDKHRMAIVHENAGGWKQMLFELAMPDLSDAIGGVMDVARLNPKARRMDKVAGEVIVSDAALRKALDAIPVAPPTGKIADVVQPPTKGTALGAVPQARAEIDSHNIYKIAATLLADTGNSSDIRILLTQFARDPRKLVEGIPANLFQSQKLLDRADSDGMIRFGSMGLNTPQVQEALNSFRSVADEYLANSSALKVEGEANKISVLAELAEATTQGGYRRYGVATEAGQAAYGATSVKVKPIPGGQAYLEYIGEGGKVVGKSDPMTLMDANSKSAQLLKEMGKGKLANRETLKMIGDIQRKIVSPIYILTNPGTWETNATSAVMGMLTDDTWIGGTTASRAAHQARLFGGVRPTKRSMEGAQTSAGFAGAQSGLVGKLREGYGAVEEFFANKTADRSVLDTLRQYGPKVLDETFTPILKQNGITDEKLIKQINRRLYEVGYNGGDMMAELGKFVTGNSQPFSLSAINPRIMEAIDPDKIEEFYTILKSTPDRAQLEQKLATFFDESRTSWETQLQSAPPVAQRHSWMKDEAKQDMADFAQVNAVAVQKGGITPQQAAQSNAQRAASDQAIAQKMETLTSMIADAQNPANRYVVYDAWMDIRKETEDVRMFQAEAVDVAYTKNSAEGWAEYHAKMDKAWKDRDVAVDAILQNTAKSLHSAAPVNPNMGVWDLVERTAKTAESKLYETLRLEPTSGRWDSRLQQVIQAGRTLVDKKVSEVFAAARRFDSPSAMDEIVSAEKNARIAGGQASNYLRKEAEKAAKTKNWDKFYQVRNEVWRQLRVYEVTVYDIAKRNIIEEGMGMGGGTGQRFTYFDEEVELIRPVEKRGVRTNSMGPRAEKVEDVQQYWQVKKADGKIELVPEAQIPKDVLEQAKQNSLKPADVDAELQMEMDNLASGATLAPEAQQVVDLGVEGTTVWRSPQGDKPVKVEPVGEVNGVTQYRTADGQTIPETELYEVTKDKKLRKVTDNDTITQAQETIYKSREEVKGAQEGRAAMRDEWNRVAKGHKGYLKLDSAVGLYVRNGIANVPENKFEDLYGNVIGGRRIESQADVNAFLQEYYNLNQRIKRSAISGNEARVAEAEAKAAKVDAEFIRKDLNLGGGASEEVIRKTRRTTSAMGGTQAPSVGLAAQHAIDQIEMMRRHVMANLDGILNPTGKMGDAQALNVLDAFKRQVMPSWDNVKYAAGEFADRMRSFTHIDFRNRTGADNVLGLGTPYSFYYTRAAKNALERMVFEPATWRRMQQINQDITEIREQQGDPKRYDGAIPAWIGNTLYYIRVSPAKYWAMFPNMIGNDYANPESANNAFSFGVEAASGAGFGMYPWLDAAGKVADGKGAEISLPGYSQQTTIASWAAMKQAGYNNKVPHMLLPPNYEYNLGREIENMVARGEIDQATGLLAQDILEQQKKGLDPLPGQTMTPALKKILDQANSRAADIQLTSQVSSYLTSVSVKPYDPIERQTAAAVTQYHNRGYGPENPYGGNEAQNFSFDQNPAMSNRFAKSGLFNPEATVRPGEGAEASMKGKEEEALYKEMNEAAQIFLRSNPEATDKEVQAIKKPFYDQLKALKDKYPNAGYPEGGDPTKGMNPAERAQYEVSKIIKSSKTDEPEYPVDGTPEQLQAYYKAMSTFTPAQQQQVQQQLTALLALDETEMPGIGQWKGELKKLVQGQYASQVILGESLRNASLEEQDWAQRMEIVKELSDLERQQATERVTKQLGAPAAELISQYLALPKGGEERKAFKVANPEVNEAMMLAFNPKEYEAAKTLFGPDAWKTYYDPKRPVWPGDNATQAQDDAYKAAMSKYNDANPQSEEIRMWVNGRRRADEAQEGQIFNNFGADWAEAKRIFGNNIFQVIADFPSNGTKEQKGKYYSAHPELTGYYQWRNDLIENPDHAPPRPTEQAQSSEWLRMQYGGQARPLGSGATPIGGQGAAPFGPLLGSTPSMQMGPGEFGPGTIPATQSTPLAGQDKAFPLGQMGEWQAGTTPLYDPLSSAMTSGASLTKTETTTPATATPGGSTEAAGATPDTALEWARQDPKFVEGEARTAAWNAQNAALDKQFGEGTSGLYQQYLDLPKGSDERKQFMRDNPDLKLAMAWMYGRGDDKDADGKTPKNNGADYEEAKKLFGDGIWDLYAQYDSTWSKAQKKAFYNEHPEYGDFTDWWYGNKDGEDWQPRQRSGSSAKNRHRVAHKGIRPGSAGYQPRGGYDSGGSSRQYAPEIYARQMDSDLKVTEQDIRPWRPDNISYSWMNAGKELRPDQLRPWKAPR